MGLSAVVKQLTMVMHFTCDRFLATFRESPEAHAIIPDGTKDKKPYAVRLSIAGGQKWRELSDEEKTVSVHMLTSSRANG